MLCRGGAGAAQVQYSGCNSAATPGRKPACPLDAFVALEYSTEGVCLSVPGVGAVGGRFSCPIALSINQ